MIQCPIDTDVGQHTTGRRRIIICEITVLFVMPSRRAILAAATGVTAVGIGGYVLTDSDRDIVDIRDFGAVGDGQTDDSDAVTAAIRAATPGETVRIPESTDPYLLSFDNDGNEAAIELGDETELNDITIAGETPANGAQTLKVEPGSYDQTAQNWVIRLNAAHVFDGLTFRNLTIDGSRPSDDSPAGVDGESSLSGVLLRHGSAGGGHDIMFENCLVQDCSANAFRFEESGVTCRNVTALRAGRHGYNPVAEDTTQDPGFVGESIKAVDCDGTGINHRRGTARLEDVYTENNRSGNKWKHHVERLVVRNHHSVRDRNSGWRSNHTNDGDTLPETQEIEFENVFIDEPDVVGMKIAGRDTEIQCKLQNVEVRHTSLTQFSAGIELTQNVTTAAENGDHLIVVGTNDGAGIYVDDNATVFLETFEHSDNDSGPSVETGQLQYEQMTNSDPGVNVFETPQRDTVGAFATAGGGFSVLQKNS